MRKWFALVALILLASVVMIVVFTSETPLKTIAIWLVGLAGLVYAGIERLFNFFGSGKELDRAEARNEELRQDAARLQLQIEESQKRLEEERGARRQEIERVEANVAQTRRDHQIAVEEVNDLEALSYEEYYRSLPIEERRRIDAEMMDGVIDGSSFR